MIKAYYALTKPGIIYGNGLTAIAGFLFASQWHIDIVRFSALVGGTALVIASACVYNNVMDRSIDTIMKRTKGRALVRGDISPRAALIYASLLGIAGFALLARYTNGLTVFIGAIAFIDYLFAYGYAKRHSIHSTLVGSISGSASITAGYVAVTGTFDSNAFFLFLLLTLWQMPHFYAIAIYRREDYAAAHLPVLSVARGVQPAKQQIMVYIALLLVAIMLFPVFGSASIVSMVILGLLTALWFVKGLRGYQNPDAVAWAKDMFLFSLIVNLAISACVAVASILPW